MFLEISLPSFWIQTAVLLSIYYVYELFITRKNIRKSIPLVGSPSFLVPRVILNLIYAFRAGRLMRLGVSQNRDNPFQIIRGDGGILLLPHYLLEEMSSIPANIASPNGALEHDLLGPYTGINLIIESRLHHSIVQRKLTPRLNLLTPELEKELVLAVEEIIPECNGWTEMKMYQLLGKISARVAARALVGPSLCHDKTWLDISVNYTEDHFRTIVILRLFPAWLHPILCRLLPSWWRGKAQLRTAKKILSPKIEELIRLNNAGKWTPDNTKKDDAHVLAWMIETAKGTDRNVDTIAHLQVLLALASVHTTLLRMVNVLYDLTAHPEYFALLEEEISAEAAAGWSPSSYSRLEKLDSILRESQRISPPTILGLKRLFKADYTFSSGLHIPAGSYVCMPTYAIENDAVSNPDEFDGLRNYHKRQGKDTAEHQFSSPDRTVLNFGYGKSACPGRFFAGLMLKILFAKLLTEYEFKFLPGTERPKNVLVHEFLFPWPWDRMLVRRKAGSCPF